MALNTYTLATRLINDTTATICNNQKVAYTYPQNKSGLANTYTVLGLVVSIETTRQRGWDLYETSIRVSQQFHWEAPNGFNEWYKNYKTSLGNFSKALVINNVDVENHSATKLQEAHDIGVLTGEGFALTIITKYIELLFNQVEKETIERQIAELNSRLVSIA